MCWVNTGRISCCFVLQLYLVVLLELLESGLVDCSHWFGQVSIELWVVQVEFVAVVMNDPREDRVLREVIE